jgi:DNA processing protein
MTAGRGLLDLIITRIPHLRPGDRMTLCQKFDTESGITSLNARDIEEICAGGRGEASAGRLFDDESGNWSMSDIVLRAEKDAALMERRGIKWVSAAENEYPPLLREIYDPPAVLFYRGALPPPGALSIAIVGTRKPCAASARWAYETARELSLAGVIVVSGLALGIDAMAHRGCVEAALSQSLSAAAGPAPAAAVFGSSVDEVYPASNRALARRIVAEGGVLFSEYPAGTRPAKWTFPARNRIISGLCRCTVVVEAGKKSGALITAGFALEQGRDLYVARNAENAGILEQPESMTAGSAFGLGCRRLAEEGARVVKDAEDILAGFKASI